MPSGNKFILVRMRNLAFDLMPDLTVVLVLANFLYDPHLITSENLSQVMWLPAAAGIERGAIQCQFAAAYARDEGCEFLEIGVGLIEQLGHHT